MFVDTFLGWVDFLGWVEDFPTQKEKSSNIVRLLLKEIFLGLVYPTLFRMIMDLPLDLMWYRKEILLYRSTRNHMLHGNLKEK